MHRLQDKVVLVTGAARSIGEAIAELFCEEGSIVILSDVNDDLGQIATTALKGKSEYHHLNVSCMKDWDLMSEHIKNNMGSPMY